MINGETKVHSLYGFPVSHSLSPIIFNNTFNNLGLNRTYLPFPVKPEKLKDAVKAARTLRFEGFNVTMPHKTRIVEMLDELDSNARRIGSVNTVSATTRGLEGYNTDGEGAARAIKAYGLEQKGSRVLVLGAGGAARSIIQTLSREAASITTLSRDHEKARKAAGATSGKSQVIHGSLTKSSFENSVKNANLLVNATPVQTTSLLQNLNVESTKLPSGLWVFDLAYDNPPGSLPEGVKRISAMEMLVQQAALSYEIWLGKPAPFQLMRSTLVQHLGGDWK